MDDTPETYESHLRRPLRQWLESHPLYEWIVGSVHRRSSATRGFSRLYLYTTDAVGFYARLGWLILDRTNWKGLDTVLMVHDL
jgi:hypothetical protein